MYIELPNISNICYHVRKIDIQRVASTVTSVFQTRACKSASACVQEQMHSDFNVCLHAFIYKFACAMHACMYVCTDDQVRTAPQKGGP